MGFASSVNGVCLLNMICFHRLKQKRIQSGGEKMSPKRYVLV